MPRANCQQFNELRNNKAFCITARGVNDMIVVIVKAASGSASRLATVRIKTGSAYYCKDAKVAFGISNITCWPRLTNKNTRNRSNKVEIPFDC